MTPLGIGEMKTRVALRNQELLEKLNDDMNNLYLNLPQPRKLHKHVRDLIDIVDQLFKRPAYRELTYVPANDILYYLQPPEHERTKRTKYWSPNMISAVKKYMGIKSVRRNNIWYWSRPVRNTVEVMNEIRNEAYRQAKDDMYEAYVDEKHKYSDANRKAATELIDIMRVMGYDANPKVVTERMRYARGTTLRVKAALGIYSFKDKDGDGAWHWVFPAPEVKEWMLDLLRDPHWVDGRVPADYIYSEAVLRGWGKLLIRLTAGNLHPAVLKGSAVNRETNEIYDYYRLR